MGAKKKFDLCAEPGCTAYALGCKPRSMRFGGTLRILQRDPKERFCGHHHPREKEKRLVNQRIAYARRGLCESLYKRKLPYCRFTEGRRKRPYTTTLPTMCEMSLWGIRLANDASSFPRLPRFCQFKVR